MKDFEPNKKKRQKQLTNTIDGLNTREDDGAKNVVERVPLDNKLTCIMSSLSFKSIFNINVRNVEMHKRETSKIEEQPHFSQFCGLNYYCCENVYARSSYLTRSVIFYTYTSYKRSNCLHLYL